jgi:hypothetical protein
MRTLGLWLPLVLVGCAFQQAMHRGEKLAGSGDWEGAFAAYGEAIAKKPEDPAAIAARLKARDQIVEEQLSNAKTSLDTGDYEATKIAIDRVNELDPDHPETFELSIDMEKSIQARFAYFWEANDQRSAYDTAIRARKLLPKAVFLNEAFERLRGHYADQAEKLLKAKEHEKALAALHVITEFEPDRQADVAPTEQRIRIHWADTLALRAATMSRASKLGAAAVLYVRAYEVAGRPNDLERARPIAAKLRDQGRTPIQLDIEGERGRIGPVRDALVAGLTGVANTTVVRSNPSLTLKVNLRPQRCTEKDAVTPTTLEYISGQVEKPNPEYAKLQALLTQAIKDEETARKQAATLMPDVDRATAALKGLDDKLALAEKEKAAAQSAFDAANTQLAATRTKRDELDTQLDVLVAQGAGKEAVDAMAAQVADATKRLAEWTEQVTKTDGAEEAGTSKVNGLQAQRTPAVQALERLKSGYDAVIKDRDAAKQLNDELTTKLASTPKTVWEDVHEVLRYDVHDWTRTCVAPSSAYARPTWKTSLQTAQNFSPAQVTTDRSHIGHLKAKLELDAKTYPESDTALVGKGDAETAKVLVGWLASLTEDSYRSRVEGAIDQMGVDPLGAATPIVSLWLGAKDRLDETVSGAFMTYLRKEFGLEKPELLLGN